ncbi:hypothetical protein RHGRI_015067 [Rhododendron griersonianum]|uniref:F-box domain-containing protein n=1 Tax=Rhododendron griersonianum TaxID=479676 RepID=A0AAV6KBX9_9ERIC|nr:hypothetical protein RHGRI_015067 [Rhododendron griersonianum]
MPPSRSLINILGRLPGKSLIRFTCVCKSWLSHICDFTYAHGLWSLAWATYMGRFRSLMEEFKKEDVAAFKWLAKHEPPHWSRSHFSEAPKCDMLLNNLWEEEAKKLHKEDYDRDERLLDQINKEQSAERGKKERKLRLRPDFVVLTSTQRWDYEKRLHDSEGFDVGDIPTYAFVPVRPFVLDSHESLERIEGYAKLALDEHKKCNNTKYQIVKALKANIDAGCPGRTYYITFQVKDTVLVLPLSTSRPLWKLFRFSHSQPSFLSRLNCNPIYSKVFIIIFIPSNTVLHILRFGTSSAVHGSDTLKQSEEHKGKARAERFGLAQSVTADEEAKKKARLSRFGAVPAVPKANAQEEDKES